MIYLATNLIQQKLKSSNKHKYTHTKRNIIIISFTLLYIEKSRFCSVMKGTKRNMNELELYCKLQLKKHFNPYIKFKYLLGKILKN